MKILYILLISCCFYSKAQFVDPSTQAQLIQLNSTIVSLFKVIDQGQKLSKENTNSNKETSVLSRENIDLVKNIEKKLYEVSDLLKTGKEYNDIIAVNVRINEKMKKLYNSFNTPFSSELRDSYMEKANKIRIKTGDLFKLSLDFLKDNKLRMTPEGRIDYLRVIRSEMSDKENTLSRMLTKIKLLNMEYHDEERRIKLTEKLMEKARQNQFSK